MESIIQVLQNSTSAQYLLLSMNENNTETDLQKHLPII